MLPSPIQFGKRRLINLISQSEIRKTFAPNIMVTFLLKKGKTGDVTARPGFKSQRLKTTGIKPRKRLKNLKSNQGTLTVWGEVRYD